MTVILINKLYNNMLKKVILMSKLSPARFWNCDLQSISGMSTEQFIYIHFILAFYIIEHLIQ